MSFFENQNSSNEEEKKEITLHDYKKIADLYTQYSKGALTEWLLGYFKIFEWIKHDIHPNACLPKPLTNKMILDYGCGEGKFCRFLAEQGAKIAGVDISAEMLKKAKANNQENINYYKIKSGEMNCIQNNSMDYCTMTFVLCISNIKEQMLKILKGINQKLKKNGLLLMLTVNWDSAGKEFASFKLKKVKKLKSGNKLHVDLKIGHKETLKVGEYFWSDQDYTNLFEQSGFKIAKIDKPIATKKMGDQHKLIDEKTSPPFSIFIARKI